MKVLIVSENEKTISCLKIFFKAQEGYEVITYRIPIKALDNFGEIAPNLVIYNAVDFPRHWKIFLQYVKSMHGSAIYDSVLVIDKKFDANEKEKSQALGVWKLLSESKLYKYVESISAETASFTDIITNVAAEAEETEYDLTPPEFEKSVDEIFNEQLIEPKIEESVDAIVDDPMPKTEKSDDIIFDEPIPEIKESEYAIFNKPIPEIKKQTEKTINELPEKNESITKIIFDPVDGEGTLEQALREQDMLLMSMETDAFQTEIPSVAGVVSDDEDRTQKSGGDFTLNEADAALLKSLELEKVNPQEVQFLFRHPKTSALVTGIVETVTGNMVVFKPDNPLVITTFSMGQYIDSASYKNGDSVSLVGAYAVPYDDTIHLTLEESAVV